MADSEHLGKLLEGVKHWNEWRDENSDIRPDLSGAVLQNENLAQANFQNVNLDSSNLLKAFLFDADLRQAVLTRSNLYGADLTGADLRGANLMEADLQKAILFEANLENAVLNGADFTDAILIQTDLKGANLSVADFTSASFLDAIVDHRTKMEGVVFRENHPVMDDGSHRMTARCWGGWLSWLNWASLRWIGQIPFFGVSWIALVAVLLTINTIGFLNHHQLLSRFVTHPIPIPDQMILILVDCLLLVFATTTFRVFCPDEVQEYSETCWVAELRRPRLLYIKEKLRRRLAQFLTLLGFASGGPLAIFLIGRRLHIAFCYIIEDLARRG